MRPPTPDPIALELWEEYLSIFIREFRLNPQLREFIQLLGGVGAELFSAEFLFGGPEVYKYSIIQAIRNAWHNTTVIHRRWQVCKELEIKEPVLDWGCGVGYMMRYFQEQGIEDVYGWDISPVQCHIMNKVGVATMEKDRKFNTIFCVNMLEHLENPMETLEMLRNMGAKVYANCDITEDIPHITPMKERIKVVRSLHKHGELLPLDVSGKTEDHYAAILR
jgi:SAM-dependent methyltransferase